MTRQDDVNSLDHPALGRVRPHAWLLALGVALAYTILATVRLDTGRATAWDFAYFQQVLWLISHGDWAARSTLNGHLALTDAGSAILYPVAFFYRLTGPVGLLALQSASLASGIPFLAWWMQRTGLAQKKSHPLIYLVYAAYPAILGPAFFDWHPDTLAVPLLFYAAWAIETRQRRHYLAAALLLLSTKVTAALTVLGLAPVWWMRRDWTMGAVSVMLALMVGAGEVLWLFPHLTGHVMSQWSQYYRWLGPTPLAGLEALLRHPWYLATVWFRKSAWFYGVILALPVGFVPLFSGLGAPGWAWPAWLILEFNAFSQFNGQLNPWNQYSVPVAPFLFISLVVLLSRLRLSPRALALGTMECFLASLLLWASAERYWVWYSYPATQALISVVQHIPPGVPVYGQNCTLALVANRPVIGFLPLPRDVPRNAWVLLNFDVNPYTRLTPPHVLAATLEELRTHSKVWRLRDHVGPVWLFQHLNGTERSIASSPFDSRRRQEGNF
ncbi:MAG: DUF2079 domain-containing protein [Firmicutes bacterium]|nr:DUF2079 domain-containing protein [Bacillota bacterium]